MSERRKARILVVDDSPTIRRVVSNVLRQAGHDVATAENGETGLAEARATDPDLIILDFMMPGMNGHQFVKQLDREDHGKAPVILMCTRTDRVPEGALKSLGVVDSITKPFSPDAILAVASYCLEKHGLRHRQETTRVTKAADASTTTTPGGADVSVASTEQERDRSGHAVREIARLLAEALRARGVTDADGVASAVCAELRADLPTRRFVEAMQPHPSLSGDLADVGLPEVLQLLKFQGQTGVMEVALGPRGASRFEVAVKNGLVVAVRARDVRTDLLLGNYFVGAGIVSRAQLEGVLEKGAGSGANVPVGQRLVEAGLVTTEQLRRCVGAQAQDLMVELLRARHGSFGLRRGVDLLPATHVNPGFSVDVLLFESLRRIDEWSVIEKQVPSFDARFVLSSADIHDLSPDEIEVLSVFKEGHPLSVHELLRVSSLRSFEACKLLYRLCILRRLRRVDDGSAANVVDDPHDHRARLAGPSRSSEAVG